MHSPEEWVAMRLAQSDASGVWVWDDGGDVVSMAAYTGPSPNGIRVNGVYTPPDRRGRGYATGCVAALSRWLLDRGRTFCFLYTDLTNPTSNAIYQRIGYRPVADVDQYAFAEE
jgi:predicted GNAT family acetyltransferase